MRKRWIKAGLILTAMLVLLSGCSKGNADTAAEKETTSAEENKPEKKTETKTESEKKEERDEGVQAGSGSASAPERKEPAAFYVYYSNDDATELVKEKVEVDEITREAVLRALVEKKVLTEDIEINSLEESEKDGEKVLDLDFSQSFASHVSNMGTAGEYMIVGSVCNTFLDAYGCEKIRITVEGGVFATGNNEYPGYLGFHE